ncbi:hypothetical protein IFT69_13205 [Pseudomonas putida]|nr:hypothetical protein [Pseudomonas putida]
MPKPTLHRAKPVIEVIAGKIYLVLYRLQPNAIIYLNMGVFETLMRNDGKEKFYHVRPCVNKDSPYPGRDRSAVLGRWNSKNGLFEMAHSAPGQPLDKVENAVKTDLFYVNVADIKRFQKVMDLSHENRQGMDQVKLCLH